MYLNYSLCEIMGFAEKLFNFKHDVSDCRVESIFMYYVFFTARQCKFSFVMHES